MRPSFFLLALVSLPVVAVSARAQSAEHPWRLGFELSAPARLLTNGSSQISLGIGESVEAARLLGSKDKLRGVALVRLNTAPVNGKGGGGTWNAGRAFVADVSVRAERSVSPRVDLFGGGGLSVWSGPDGTAPFTGSASLHYAAELGGSSSVGATPWRGSVTVHITQFGPDDTTQQQSGGVIRILVGAHRDY